MPKWEYRVVHINVENTKPPMRRSGSSEQDRAGKSQASPQQASQHLHGALSPSFIAREFPEYYSLQGGDSPKGTHPAEQLQSFLNKLGINGWEMTTTAQVGALLMFFFKRPLRELPPTIKPTQSDETSLSQ
jgi:hypothetical protein